VMISIGGVVLKELLGELLVDGGFFRGKELVVREVGGFVDDDVRVQGLLLED
jgi:hypothetical protein